MTIVPTEIMDRVAAKGGRVLPPERPGDGYKAVIGTSNAGAVFESPQGAWRHLAIETCVLRPGRTVLSTPEFGEITRANILSDDGGLALGRWRKRLEVREARSEFEVFLVERFSIRGSEPRDVRQRQLAGGDAPTRAFRDIGDAARFAREFVLDYNGAVAEDRIDAVEAMENEQEEGRLGM